MATTKKPKKRTTKKVVKKRYLTEAERDKILKHFQTFMPYLVKLRDNENIDTETRGVIRMMHNRLKDALAYYDRLNFLK